MSLPTQAEVELPLLRVLESFGGEAKPSEVYGPVAKNFPQLSAEDLRARLDSGPMKWWNHVQWTRQRLVQKGEIDGSVRGVWRITPLGRVRLNNAEPGKFKPSPSTSSLVRSESPTELIETAHHELRAAL